MTGAIPRDSALYVHRDADDELFEALLRGELCYVLSTRQIGKTSLRVQVARHLEDEGVRCIGLDLNALATEKTTPGEWYNGLLVHIARGLGHTYEEAKSFWEQHEDLSFVQRLDLYLSEEMSRSSDLRLVIFLDELDSVLRLDFRADDFFALVRAIHNRRAETATPGWVTFCLIGVATPRDLINDPVRTPFNVGHGVHLADFTLAEAGPLRRQLEGIVRDPQSTMEQVFAFTAGHPAMTQQLCEEVTKAAVRGEVDVAQVVKDHLLGAKKVNALMDAQYKVDRLPFELRVRALRLYGQILAGQSLSSATEDPAQVVLRLAGMIVEVPEGQEVRLRVRNRIFALVFNKDWVRQRETRLLLAEPLARWLDAQRDPDYLLRGKALDLALSWARAQGEDLSPDERAFLNAGREQAQEEERQRTHLEELAAARRPRLAVLAGSVVFERFSYYTLIGVMGTYLTGHLGAGAGLWVQLFPWLIYMSALPGGVLADAGLGHRRSVLLGALMLVLSHGLLISNRGVSLLPALLLAVIGHGLYKPNIVVLLHNLYPTRGWDRETAFLLFYLGINVGGLLASLSTAALRHQDLTLNFVAAGTGQLVSLGGVFLLNRYFSASEQRAALQSGQTSAAVPGGAAAKDRYNLRVLLGLGLLILPFWSFYQSLIWQDQCKLSLFAQARSQPPLQRVALGAINSGLVILLIPALIALLFVLARRRREPWELSKMVFGSALTGIGLMLMAFAAATSGSERVSLLWPLFALLCVTVGEVFVVPAGLSLVSRLAPRRRKATVLGLWYLASGVSSAVGALLEFLSRQLSYTQYFLAVACGSFALALLASRMKRQIAAAEHRRSDTR